MKTVDTEKLQVYNYFFLIYAIIQFLSKKIKYGAFLIIEHTP